MKKKRSVLDSSPRLIAASFAAAIVIGTVFLMLPVSSADRAGTGFVDALFTSVSSVCVTGLTTLPTAGHWSLFGKVVILFLIQIGGLGVISLMMMFLVFIHRRVTLKERVLLQDYYNQDTPEGIVRLMVHLVRDVFIAEGIGAVLLSLRFIPRFGVGQGIWFSVFHAVSAFCNAGMDLFGTESLALFASDWYVNVVLMLLIVFGGIGFPVWWDLAKSFHDRKKRSDQNFFERLSLHSKLVLVISGFLLLLGAVFVFAIEYDNPDTFGSCSFGEKILQSCFYSVTLRTAGFTTFDPSGLHPAVLMLSCMLMLVGGSPVGTAGGIKTTTVGMLFLVVWAQIRGKKNAEAFGRRVSGENLGIGISVVVISLCIFFAAMLILLCTEDASIEQIVFETASALGTVGISLGLTETLSTAGKIVLIFCMYIGRIGPITMATAFTLRKSSPDNLRELPEQRIIIG